MSDSDGGDGADEGPDTRRALLLYGRPACHLCDVALEQIVPLAKRLGVAVQYRNVEDHPEWERRYGHLVPVGLADGRMLFKYRVDPARLETALRRRGLC